RKEFGLRAIDTKVSLCSAKFDCRTCLSSRREIRERAQPLPWIFNLQIDHIWYIPSIFCHPQAARKIRPVRAVFLGEHVNCIHPMHELIGQNAPRKIAIVSKIEKLRRIPFAPPNGSDVAIPIEIRGLFLHSPGYRVSASSAASAGDQSIRAAVVPPRSRQK